MKINFIVWSLMIGAISVASCKKVKEAKPELLCGTGFSEECLDKNWIINKPSTAFYRVLSNYEGRNVLLLVNSHPSTQVNPRPVLLDGFIKNIKPNKIYQVSCDVKLKGYSDYLRNNPGFFFYAHSNEHWYGEIYVGSEPGVYLDQDWTKMKYNFTSGPEAVLSFQLGSLYDSAWISNLVIKEL